MKKFMNLGLYIAAILFASNVFSQNIPMPASSADTGVRASIGITPLTQSDVQRIVGETATTNSPYDRSWTSYFPYQTKCDAGGGSINAICAMIDPLGRVGIYSQSTMRLLTRYPAPSSLNAVFHFVDQGGFHCEKDSGFMVVPTQYDKLTGSAPLTWMIYWDPGNFIHCGGLGQG